MWTTENRPRYDRDKLRYPSDLTDEEWSLIVPLIRPAKRGGRKREVVVREVVNGVMYVLSTGCQWRYIPKDLPPRSTVHDLDVVALLADLPVQGLARGQVGTVVERLDDNTLLVEFSDDRGHAYSVAPCQGEALLVLHYVQEPA